MCVYKRKLQSQVLFSWTLKKHRGRVRSQRRVIFHTVSRDYIFSYVRKRTKAFFRPCPSKIFKSTNFSNNTKLSFLRVTRERKREREPGWARGIQHFLVACSTTSEITIRLISNAIFYSCEGRKIVLIPPFFLNSFST